ncbi:MAG: hypothetical protein AABX04_04270 [Nanoarchaeota archaeon]
MDQVSNKTIVSLLLVALVVTVIGTVMSVSKITSPEGSALVGAAVVAKTPTINLDQSTINYNTLKKEPINKIVVLLKNQDEISKRATVVATLISKEEALLSTASIAKIIPAGETEQTELNLDLREVELGEYTLQLDTYYDGKLALTKQLSIVIIE